MHKLLLDKHKRQCYIFVVGAELLQIYVDFNRLVSSTKTARNFPNMVTYEKSFQQVGLSRITVKADHSDTSILRVLYYNLNHGGGAS